MLQLDKDSLRKQIINKLENLSQTNKEEIEVQLHDNLYKSSIWKQAKTIGLTCSTDIEWNTMPIMKQAWKQGKIISVPKTIREKAQMKFYRIDSFSQLISGYQQILEPVENQQYLMNKHSIDLLIVPGIVFDESGYRIGFGGGYYDRFLIDYPHTTVSLLSRLQLVRQLPIEKHDIHVQYLITEAGLCKTNNRL